MRLALYLSLLLVVPTSAFVPVHQPVRANADLNLFGGLFKKIFGPAPTPVGLEDTETFANALEKFPGAKSNPELIEYLNEKLKSKDFNIPKTLVATSLCCDEVNRPLETALSDMFDTNFNMGGLAGCPFGGVTSFGAMTAHIPDGGGCVVIYGPHVGVDSKGAVGTVERRGKVNGGACCGSAVAASNYVAGVLAGEAKASLPDDALDAQQYFVGSMLMPYAERLNAATDRMLELPYALYDAQTELMNKIVEGGAAAGTTGNVAVMGGIQINTPPGYLDYFLPLNFDLYTPKGKLIEKMM